MKKLSLVFINIFFIFSTLSAETYWDYFREHSPEEKHKTIDFSASLLSVQPGDNFENQVDGGGGVSLAFHYHHSFLWMGGHVSSYFLNGKKEKSELVDDKQTQFITMVPLQFSLGADIELFSFFSIIPFIDAGPNLYIWSYTRTSANNEKIEGTSLDVYPSFGLGCKVRFIMSSFMIEIGPTFNNVYNTDTKKGLSVNVLHLSLGFTF